jgi:hypothetical protein
MWKFDRKKKEPNHLKKPPTLFNKENGRDLIGMTAFEVRK